MPMEAPDSATVREVAGRALRYWDAGGELEALQEVYTHVYSFRRGGADLVLRIRPVDAFLDEGMVAAELHWAAFLAAKGAAVCAPVPDMEGRYVRVLSGGDRPFTACVFVKAPGRRLDYASHPEDWSRPLHVRLGSLIGVLHRLTRSYRPDGSLPPRDDMREEVERLLEFCSRPSDMPVKARTEFREVAAWIRGLPAVKDDYGLIHGDIQGNNFFVHGEEIRVFDTSDCFYGWFAYDLATPVLFIRYMTDRSEGEFIEALLEGYLREYPLGAEWIDRIGSFGRFRRVLTLTATYDRLSRSAGAERERGLGHPILRLLLDEIGRAEPLV